MPDWIQTQTVKDEQRIKILESKLDTGEASAIALGIENEQSLLLIDERKGRIIAQNLNLKTTGTLGVLIKAKENSLISSLEDEINKLKAINFYLSETLTQRILEKYN